MTALARFNNQPAADATAQLLACCGSELWANRMAAARPFASVRALIESAEACWLALAEPDWISAFSCHPRIGEESPDSATSFLHSSGLEQATVQRTLGAVANSLSRYNLAYEEKFGFRYIVFASGRTAPELLAVLEQRLTHSRAAELHEAARQQLQITNLRLRKWLQA